MFKIFFILLCIAFYYFSTITYTTSDTAYKKEDNVWSFTKVETKDIQDKYYFEYFITYGKVVSEKSNSKASTITFSYAKK